LNAGLQGRRDAVKHLHEEVKEARPGDQGPSEAEVESRRQRILKLRASSSVQVKSNEDYRTLQGEIVRRGEGNQGPGGRELVLMEETEAARGNTSRPRSSSACRRGSRDRPRARRCWTMRASPAIWSCAGLRTDPGRPGADVDKDWLGRYERIMSHASDYAIVGIERGTCGGCHMALPPQVVRDAGKELSLILCSYCGRILYMKR